MFVGSTSIVKYVICEVIKVQYIAFIVLKIFLEAF